MFEYIIHPEGGDTLDQIRFETNTTPSAPPRTPSPPTRSAPYTIKGIASLITSEGEIKPPLDTVRNNLMPAFDNSAINPAASPTDLHALVHCLRETSIETETHHRFLAELSLATSIATAKLTNLESKTLLAHTRSREDLPSTISYLLYVEPRLHKGLAQLLGYTCTREFLAEYPIHSPVTTATNGTLIALIRTAVTHRGDTTLRHIIQRESKDVQAYTPFLLAVGDRLDVYAQQIEHLHKRTMQEDLMTTIQPFISTLLYESFSSTYNKPQWRDIATAPDFVRWVNTMIIQWNTSLFNLPPLMIASAATVPPGTPYTPTPPTQTYHCCNCPPPGNTLHVTKECPNICTIPIHKTHCTHKGKCHYDLRKLDRNPPHTRYYIPYLLYP
jgi:hypothetical protein